MKDFGDCIETYSDTYGADCSGRSLKLSSALLSFSGQNWNSDLNTFLLILVFALATELWFTPKTNQPNPPKAVFSSNIN